MARAFRLIHGAPFGRVVDGVIAADPRAEEHATPQIRAPPRTLAWIARNDAVVREQAAVRNQLPRPLRHERCGGGLAKVRDAIRSRTFVLRNQARTNRLLGLMRHNLNGYDGPVAYHHVLREQAENNCGHGEPQAQNRDPKGEPSLRATRL